MPSLFLSASVLIILAHLAPKKQGIFKKLHPTLLGTRSAGGSAEWGKCRQLSLAGRAFLGGLAHG